VRTIEKKFRHVDLFSGIGGFAYAAKAVWQEDYETVFFCDNDKFCQEVLRKRFPEVKIWGDIRELITDTTSGRCDKYWRNESDRSSDNNKWKQEAWNKNWIEVAAELCGIYDGFPAELDGLKLSKSRHRVERLKSLGNAIVPQVAIEIMKSMKEFDENAKI